MENKKQLSQEQQKELISILKTRYEKYSNRHQGIEWAQVEARLYEEKSAEKLWSINEMERTGGEPDVLGFNETTGCLPAGRQEFLFFDCSTESPKGRRSVCYDQAALESRKEYKPENSAMKMAADMGIDILTEAQYRDLQMLGDFDTKTSSWIITPGEIRKLGGALFCDRRYNTVFVYHNGAESYYAVRGFRGCVKI